MSRAGFLLDKVNDPLASEETRKRAWSEFCHYRPIVVRDPEAMFVIGPDDWTPGQVIRNMPFSLFGHKILTYHAARAHCRPFERVWKIEPISEPVYYVTASEAWSLEFVVCEQAHHSNYVTGYLTMTGGTPETAAGKEVRQKFGFDREVEEIMATYDEKLASVRKQIRENLESRKD